MCIRSAELTQGPLWSSQGPALCYILPEITGDPREGNLMLPLPGLQRGRFGFASFLVFTLGPVMSPGLRPHMQASGEEEGHLTGVCVAPLVMQASSVPC